MSSYVGKPVGDLTAAQHANIAPLVWPVWVGPDGEAYPCGPEDANAMFVVSPDDTVVERTGEQVDVTLAGEIIPLQKELHEPAN